MIKFYILYLFSISSVFCAETVNDYKIDWLYSAGNYLVYDCEKKHYACVTKINYNDCLENRKLAIDKKSEMYPCAPLAKFEDKKSCVLESYKIVDLNQVKRFCYPK